MNSQQRRQFLKSSLTLSTIVAAGSLLSACGSHHNEAQAPKNIVELAKATPDLSILVEAVVAADLVGALSGAGPLTVFAPTNAAFADLLAELGVTKQALLADKALLTAVLTYHVLGAKVKKADIPLGKAIDPILTGSSDIFKIDIVAGGPVITDGRNRSAKITTTDIEASNGVVHVIDKVILPANKDIVATAQALPDFSILVEALVQANLVTALQGTGPFTVFAPTNAAFAALLTELNVTKAQLLALPNLADILKYHVVSGRVLKADVPVGAAITPLAAGTFTVNSALQIIDGKNRASQIGLTDVLTSNGVIHVIDKVLLPA